MHGPHTSEPCLGSDSEGGTASGFDADFLRHALLLSFGTPHSLFVRGLLVPTSIFSDCPTVCLPRRSPIRIPPLPISKRCVPRSCLVPRVFTTVNAGCSVSPVLL